MWIAQSCFDEIISQKMAKGYYPVALEGEDCLSPAKKPQLNFDQINDKVLQLVGKFYHEAIGFITASIETPLGKISAGQVRQGTDVLDMIERTLKRGQSLYNLEDLSNHFYSVIPVIFGSRVDREKMLIDSYEKLMEKREMLDVMSSVADAQKNLQSTIEEKYKFLGISIQEADREISERIKNMILKSQSRNHRFKIQIINIFEVKSMAHYNQFNPYKVSILELFHGSRNCNMLGIMQHGLKIKPSAAVHTGSMFGEGIYFASQSSKSANYCWGFGGANQSLDTNFLMVCEVATGKIKEYTDPQLELKSAPKGFNSVMGKKGPNLLHDEYIVYNENQARIRYIIEFKRC